MEKKHVYYVLFNIFVVSLCLSTYIYEWYTNNVYVDLNILIISINVFFGILYVCENNLKMITMYISILVCFYMIFTYNQCIKSIKDSSSYSNDMLYGLIVGSALTQFFLPSVAYVDITVEGKRTKEYLQKIMLMIYIVTMTILNQIMEVLIDSEYNTVPKISSSVVYSFLIVNYASILIMLFFIGVNFKMCIKTTEMICVNTIVIISILQTIRINVNMTEKFKIDLIFFLIKL